MIKRRIGKTDLYVNPVGFGCMGLSHAYGPSKPKDESIDIIKKTYEIGYNLFDTAESYTGLCEDGTLSNNEELVGEALSEVRDDVVIASKFGVRFGDERLLTDSRPETIRKSVEGSLSRLGIDTIDIYYQHRMDPEVTPEDVAGTMAELIDEGKIRAWGISEVTEEYLRRAHEVCPVSAIQNRYSMLTTEHANIFPVCEELGISFVAFSPMANGFLTGAYTKDDEFGEDDFRSFMPQYSAEGFESAKELIALLDDLSKSKDATMAQISLAWMINKKDFIIPIPGSTKIKNIESNYQAGNVKRSRAEISEIDELLEVLNVPMYGKE